MQPTSRLTRPILLLLYGLLAVMVWAGFSARVLAEPLPPLSDELLPQWTAVGLVNGSGVERPRGCTGTLIAPDLVLTAAHCAGREGAIPQQRHFVAGWDRGNFIAHRTARDVTVHPLYPITEAPARFRYDIALVRLHGQISPDLVRPLPLADWPAEEPLGLVAYQNQRPGRVNGRFDCQRLGSTDDTLLRIGCEVVSGNSGGPVLVRQGDGWAVAAVLVARAEPDGDALAVPLADWVIDAWRDAMARADATPG